MGRKNRNRKASKYQPHTGQRQIARLAAKLANGSVTLMPAGVNARNK